MTRDQSTEIACAIVALAYRTRGDYTEPSDGFCKACAEHTGPAWVYKNAGEQLAYVVAAVKEKLERDGFIPDPAALRDLEERLAK